MIKKQNGLYNSELYWTISYFSLNNYWMYFNFCFCFFDLYSYRDTCSAMQLKLFAITVGIKNYKSINKKKKKMHD